MGAGERLRESFPDIVIAAAEPLPGDSVMGLRSLEDGYVPPILDVTKLDRKMLVSNAESVRAVKALLELEGIFAGVSCGAADPRGAEDRRGDGRGRDRHDPHRRRLEVHVRGLLGGLRRGPRGVHGTHDLVVVPAAVRAALVEHANAELPNEACGLVLFEDDVAVEYVPGRNVSASPYHFQLEIDPVTWADLNDSDAVQAVFHSHISSPPRPSRTDVQNIGLWAGQPYLIYTVRTDELAAWRIVDGAIVSSADDPPDAKRGRLEPPPPCCRAPGSLALERDPGYLTVNEPFMNGCGSQMNLYVPFFSVTVNVFVPTPRRSSSRSLPAP